DGVGVRVGAVAELGGAGVLRAAVDDHFEGAVPRQFHAAGEVLAALQARGVHRAGGPAREQGLDRPQQGLHAHPLGHPKGTEETTDYTDDTDNTGPVWGFRLAATRPVASLRLRPGN